ncbi:MAG: metallophosphoesterase [Methanobacterium sp.]|nr:metallophosphoesterase [Methanobacterium sp.]
MIGLMSDSHDNLPAIEAAIEYFNQEQVDLVIHAGDLISPFTARQFMKLKTPFTAIYGNNDGERAGLREAYKKMCILEDFKEISVNNRKLAVIHGTNQALVESLSCCKKYDVIIKGHTHEVEIIKEESLIINPGETCGYLTGDRTIVLLEPDDLTHQVIYL